MVSPELAPEQGLEEEFQKLREVEVSVKVLFSLAAGEPVYLGGYPVDMSIDYQLEVPQAANYRISLGGSEAELAVEAESLPLRPARGGFAATRNGICLSRHANRV